jgi:hypothetical protein
MRSGQACGAVSAWPNRSSLCPPRCQTHLCIGAASLGCSNAVHPPSISMHAPLLERAGWWCVCVARYAVLGARYQPTTTYDLRLQPLDAHCLKCACMR